MPPATPAPLPDPVHFTLDSRDGQAEHARIGTGENGYPVLHTSAAKHGPYSAGHAVQDVFVFQPAGR